MREILFRGRRVDNGEWVYGDLEHCGVMALVGQVSIDRNGYKHYEKVRVIPETVGQYTGVEDENDVRIFEGDFVYLVGYSEYLCEFPFMKLYESAFENEVGSISGNIHDNPELF